MIPPPETVVLFDAVGTLLQPHPGVIEVYHDFGVRHGCKHSFDEIKKRFKSGRVEFFRKGVSAKRIPFASAEFRSSDAAEFELWFSLIKFVFDDVTDVTAITRDLWNHFSQACHWRLFEDVRSCLQQFADEGFKIGIASNFDSRIVGICSILLPEFDRDNIFWSSRIGFRKPDQRFYEYIAEALPAKKIAMIGDDPLNDCIAPASFGWRTFMLDRDSRHVAIAQNRISSLSELKTRLAENS